MHQLFPGSLSLVIFYWSLFCSKRKQDRKNRRRVKDTNTRVRENSAFELFLLMMDAFYQNYDVKS